MKTCWSETAAEAKQGHHSSQIWSCVIHFSLHYLSISTPTHCAADFLWFFRCTVFIQGILMVYFSNSQHFKLPHILARFCLRLLLLVAERLHFVVMHLAKNPWSHRGEREHFLFTSLLQILFYISAVVCVLWALQWTRHLIVLYLKKKKMLCLECFSTVSLATASRWEKITVFLNS